MLHGSESQAISSWILARWGLSRRSSEPQTAAEMADSDIPLSVRKASRRYGSRLALDAVDLDLVPGQILGLVGPNGSGKTTLLKLVGGFLRPHGGSVRVFGVDPFRDQSKVMLSASFAFAPPALFDELTPAEHLGFLAPMGRPGRRSKSAGETEAVLERVGLRERASDRVGTFSFGMRQRLVLAMALTPMPRLLVLDEPTDGLDPLGVLALRRILIDLKRQGVAILLSSHLLSEMGELADRLLVLDTGKTLFAGEPEELTHGLERLRLRVDDPMATKLLLEQRGLGVTIQGDELELPAGALTAQDAARCLGAQGLELLEFRVHHPSFEEALIARMQGGLGT